MPAFTELAPRPQHLSTQFIPAFANGRYRGMPPSTLFEPWLYDAESIGSYECLCPSKIHMLKS